MREWLVNCGTKEVDRRRKSSRAPGGASRARQNSAEEEDTASVFMNDGGCGRGFRTSVSLPYKRRWGRQRLPITSGNITTDRGVCEIIG